MVDRLVSNIFGDVGKEVIKEEKAKGNLYSGPVTFGRFDVTPRRDLWNNTHSVKIPVVDLQGRPLYLKDADGEIITNRRDERLAVEVPNFNTFLEADIVAGVTSLDAFRFVDLTELLRSNSSNLNKSVLIKQTVQKWAGQILSAKKGNAADTPVRLLVCTDPEYVASRRRFFSSPQDMVAYGKATVTSHEVIVAGSFKFLVVAEGELGTADGQGRMSIPLTRESGYNTWGQKQFRLEFEELDLLAAGSLLPSVRGEDVDLILPISIFKGRKEIPVEVGRTYKYHGRLGIMADAASRDLKIRDNIEVQHYYRDLDWPMVMERLGELHGAHKTPRGYLEVVNDLEERQEDFMVHHAVLKAVLAGGEEACYVGQTLMKHPWIARKIYNHLLAQYADAARCANHRFDGAYLACLEALPDDVAFVPGGSGNEWVFRIPMLSAGNFARLKIVDEDYLYSLMNGDKAHDAELTAAMRCRGSIFTNSTVAKVMNSDFDFDPMCRCGEDDPHHVKLDLVAEDWHGMPGAFKPKERTRSQWHKFGTTDAVSAFLNAPNIGALTLLQHNIFLRKDDANAVKFLKGLGLTVQSAAELTGLATTFAVAAHKWSERLPEKKQDTVDELLKFFTGKSPFHRSALAEIRAGNTDWDVEPDHFLNRLVLKVRDALKEDNLEAILDGFNPGTFFGFLGSPSDLTLNDEVIDMVKDYNVAIAKVLTSTKEGSLTRGESITVVCETNRCHWAYLREAMDHKSFKDAVRILWNAGHEAAERSKKGSKASVVFTAGVADIIVDCLNDEYGGFGRVPRDYTVLRPEEHPAPRVRLYGGWKGHAKDLGYDPREIAMKLRDDEDAKAAFDLSVVEWGKTLDKVVGRKVIIGYSCTKNGKSYKKAIFYQKKILGEVRSTVVEPGTYILKGSMTLTGTVLVILTPVFEENGTTTARHLMKVIGLWQDVPGDKSNARKAAKTIEKVKAAKHLAGVEIKPDELGLGLYIKGVRCCKVVSGSPKRTNHGHSVVTGKVRVVDIVQDGQLSAFLTVDHHK